MLMIVIKSTGVIRMQQKISWNWERHLEIFRTRLLQKSIQIASTSTLSIKSLFNCQEDKNITTTLEEVNFRKEHRITSDPQSLFTDEVYKNILFDLEERITRRTVVHNPSREDER